jgi:hypothetical protein
MKTNHSFIGYKRTISRYCHRYLMSLDIVFEYRKLAYKNEYPDLFYLLDWYLVAAFVPSETACLASSPGRIKRTEVWISREEMVDLLL